MGSWQRSPAPHLVLHLCLHPGEPFLCFEGDSQGPAIPLSITGILSGSARVPFGKPLAHICMVMCFLLSSSSFEVSGVIYLLLWKFGVRDRTRASFIHRRNPPPSMACVFRALVSGCSFSSLLLSPPHISIHLHACFYSNTTWSLLPRLCGIVRSGLVISLFPAL